MPELYGIENIKKVFAVIIEGGNVAEKMIKETGGTIKKLGHLISIADELFDLTKINFSEFKNELLELGGEDKDKLYAFLKEKLDLEDDKVETKIEEGFNLLLEVEAVIQKTINFVKA